MQATSAASPRRGFEKSKDRTLAVILGLRPEDPEAGRLVSRWVYILASQRNGTLYVGVTSDLQGRISEHRQGLTPGFTFKYGCKTLVWYERHEGIESAIQREKSLKRYLRKWKLNLIETFNPEWCDLFETCYERDNPFVPTFERKFETLGPRDGARG